MNDRELLQLAARAAGYQFSYSYRSLSSPAVPVVLAETGRWRQWDPRHDDGDALRLAVKRGLVVTSDRENQRTLVSNQAGHEYCAIYWDKLGEMAATRLAITEAAAEIGRRNQVTQPGATSSP
ncbi:TPA: hypothetical protein SL532_001627 [Pseudomonas aeruginosa]|uniref:hypothetical protein n=1 Tax=Pseudomonas aeruginosa TaxID=287 RepID=UPI0013CE2EF8|nr:hypothetical protein [Pseudomonas aeruginosa]MBH4255564.1 hypothetical protein [Pseudomonas aeruginosa]MCS7773726.1 hypothetical protein [Pseudomonas aeruginosa]MCS8361544.1 hypothetical protein [Pseudomonas aeruginosa]MCS8644856.1 hypothetical protein [Pseudomonas aeruginosa]MCT0643857.1 hypothetical protein [Pseudomonas aeruginosa]